MTVKHIIFDASVLAKFPQTDNFFRTARNSAMGATAYIRSHCVPRTDVCYLLNLLARKNIEIIILSKAAGAALVMDTFGLPYSRCISSIDELDGNPSEYGYVTTTAMDRDVAKQSGFQAVRFVPGIGQDTCEILALAGYRKQLSL